MVIQHYRDYYSDGEKLNADSYEYWGGQIIIKIRSVTPMSLEEFTKEILERAMII